MDKDGQGFLFSVVFLERVLTKHFKNLFTIFLANINVVTQSYLPRRRGRIFIRGEIMRCSAFNFILLTNIVNHFYIKLLIM